ncbi:MAG: signal transduction histidine kinase/CheY-like chemotaxis protein [Myxococcota bacterium]|jgi:signal transduction histidine kinase/CheY-like chemotaxis protein
MVLASLLGMGIYIGINNSVPAWMVLLLLLTTLLGGFRVGLAWAIICAGAYVTLAIAQMRGLIPLVEMPPESSAITDLLGYLLLFAATLGVGLSYEGVKKRALHQLAAARDAARDASAAKSTFLATMSHEIRTPMNGVLGIAEILEGTELDDEQLSLVRTLRTSGGALVDIISDILDFSKIEADRLKLDREPVSPRMLIEDVVALFEPSAKQARLQLYGVCDPDLPHWLWGDGTRLRQVLTNLVSNAVKFTAVGEVAVRAVREGESQWRLEVTDTGPGIPLAQQERLFEAFTQAESATTRRFGGTGLGLSICRRLTELMDGEIGLESHERRGSRFWVSLPFEEVPSHLQPTADDVVESGGLLQGHVLLVEDHPVNQLVVVRMLQSLGLTVQLAEHGEAALAVLETGTFALVLMDCQMPVMDGYTATRLAREKGCSVPIIALTADVTAAARSAAEESGMNDYLTKPISTDKLRHALRRYLPPARS